MPGDNTFRARALERAAPKPWVYPTAVFVVCAVAASAHHVIGSLEWQIAILGTAALGCVLVLVAKVPRQRVGFMRLWFWTSVFLAVLRAILGN